MKFLKANWNNLILASYEVPKEVLLPYVPVGTELDSCNGIYYVSLVAFMFHDTRVLGLPVPYHINFEEVNLRFYVTPSSDRSKKSVVFIKEIVPLKAIEMIANSLFHENYATTKMDHEFTENSYTYSWKNDGETQLIKATVTEECTLPEKGSLEEFISEHYWGYTKSPNTTHAYEVKHSQWTTCLINDYVINVDFKKVYGADFAFLNESAPAHVCFSEGSRIEVMSAQSI